MFNIENKIKENLAYFNDQEPDEGHQSRFINRLSNNTSAKPKKISIQLFSKVAAAILILIATSFLLLKVIDMKVGNERTEITQIEYTDDFKKVQAYYDNLSIARLDKIDELATSEEEAQRLKANARKKMEKLDANLAMIEKEYVKNPQCKKLKAAIVSNKKMKVEIVDNIVEQLDFAHQGYHAGSMFTNY